MDELSDKRQQHRQDRQSPKANPAIVYIVYVARTPDICLVERAND